MRNSTRQLPDRTMLRATIGLARGCPRISGQTRSTHARGLAQTEIQSETGARDQQRAVTTSSLSQDSQKVARGTWCYRSARFDRSGFPQKIAKVTARQSRNQSLARTPWALVKARV